MDIPNEISEGLAIPIHLELDGFMWKFSRLNDDIKGKTESWIQGHVLGTLIRNKALYPAEDYQEQLRIANRDIASGVYAYGEPGFFECLKGGDTQLAFFMEVLAPNHPELAKDGGLLLRGRVKHLLRHHRDEMIDITKKLFDEFFAARGKSTGSSNGASSSQPPAPMAVPGP